MPVRSIRYAQIVEDFLRRLQSYLASEFQMKNFHERGNLHLHVIFSWSLVLH